MALASSQPKKKHRGNLCESPLGGRRCSTKSALAPSHRWYCFWPRRPNALAAAGSCGSLSETPTPGHHDCASRDRGGGGALSYRVSLRRIAWADLPEFCRVVATISPRIDSKITVEVWLPVDRWNGRYHAIGNGGYGGGDFRERVSRRAEGWICSELDRHRPYGDPRRYQFRAWGILRSSSILPIDQFMR